MRIFLKSFSVVDERCEDDNAEDKKEDEQEKFLGTCLERVDKNFESARVTRQLEETQDSNDGEEVKNVGILQTVGKALQQNVRIKGHGRNEVDYVDHVLAEDRLAGGDLKGGGGGHHGWRKENRSALTAKRMMISNENQALQMLSM